MSELEDAIRERDEAREAYEDEAGHKCHGVAGKLWHAANLFAFFKERLSELLGAPDDMKLGHDWYDQSLEIYDVPEDLRLGLEAQQLIRDGGFGLVYVNHGAKGDDYRWETHYRVGGDAELPVRGWRRRYVSDAAADTTRVIAGPEDPGYYEISFWPEDWTGERILADRERGFFRIVPDPLDPLAVAA